MHDSDPTSKEQADPWRDLSARLGSLGDRLKEAYGEIADGDAPSEEEIESAFSTLRAAWGQVAESALSALSDDETRARLREAAGSFATALGATMRDLGDELRHPPPPDDGGPAAEDG